MPHPYVGNVFRGRMTMRGRGIGSMFARMFRSSVPFLKTLGKNLGGYAGRQLLESGAGIIQDMNTGLGVKAALQKNAQATRNKVFADLKTKLSGGGRRRKLKKTNSRKRKRVETSCKKNKKNKDPF